jgi:hypothetical protein
LEYSIEQHSWVIFAKDHATDVTQDDHYAINMDTGERWDEDYGPIEVGGYGGIKLQALPLELESKVQGSTQVMIELSKKQQN